MGSGDSKAASVFFGLIDLDLKESKGCQCRLPHKGDSLQGGRVDADRIDRDMPRLAVGQYSISLHMDNCTDLCSTHRPCIPEEAQIRQIIIDGQPEGLSVLVDSIEIICRGDWFRKVRVTQSVTKFANWSRRMYICGSESGS